MKAEKKARVMDEVMTKKIFALFIIKTGEMHQIQTLIP